jgi:hypothetical protein
MLLLHRRSLLRNGVWSMGRVVALLWSLLLLRLADRRAVVLLFVHHRSGHRE